MTTTSTSTEPIETVAEDIGVAKSVGRVGASLSCVAASASGMVFIGAAHPALGLVAAGAGAIGWSLMSIPSAREEGSEQGQPGASAMSRLAEAAGRVGRAFHEDPRGVAKRSAVALGAFGAAVGVLMAATSPFGAFCALGAVGAYAYHKTGQAMYKSRLAKLEERAAALGLPLEKARTRYTESAGDLFAPNTKESASLARLAKEFASNGGRAGKWLSREDVRRGMEGMEQLAAKAAVAKPANIASNLQRRREAKPVAAGESSVESKSAISSRPKSL